MYDLLLDNSLFSPVYFKFVLGTFITFFIILHSILKVVGEKLVLPKAIITSVIMAFFITICRRFVPPPFNMLLYYLLMVVVVVFVFRLPFKKSIVGVIFALLLTMLSSVTVTMNLLMHTKNDAATRNNVGVFLLMSLTEVFFNLVYVLLAARYKKLNLSFLFSEEENAKA